MIITEDGYSIQIKMPIIDPATENMCNIHFDYKVGDGVIESIESIDGIIGVSLRKNQVTILKSPAFKAQPILEEVLNILTLQGDK